MPTAFSSYDGTDPKRAVSFDRVVFQVKRIDNKPVADLAFWKIALKERLLKTGYVLTKDGDITAIGATGYFIETSAPYGVVDYNYLVAVFVDNKDIVVVEAAGEVASYQVNRENIFVAIRGLNFDANKTR
jgi:hypothetical protein